MFRKKTDNGVDGITIKQYVGKAPKNLVEKSALTIEDRLCEARLKAVQQAKSAKYKYYCSACLIIRDENEYLSEWLHWHICQGVEHFYIYDHGSKIPVKEFISATDKDLAKIITFIDWAGVHEDAQPDAYNDCLNRFRGESRWIAFIDTDEQIRVKTGQTLPQFLKDYEDYAGVFAVWLTYNANGQMKKKDGLLRERFTKISRAEHGFNLMGKAIVQPMYMDEMVIHNGRAREGFYIVTENKKKMKNYVLGIADATTDFICVDHYYTKSYEEWLSKIQRGSGHANYQRKYDEFFRVNEEMEYCREDIKLRQSYNNSDKRY